MILMVSGATTAYQRLAADPARRHLLQYLGHLATPRSRNSRAYLFSTGRPVGADNDCFKRLKRAQYLRMLRLLQGSRVLWVAAPDVVADARATMARWRIWRPALRYLGLPAAYVAQDGSEELAPPWADLDCLFIGGSTAWKEGPHAMRLMLEAKDRGKWVHVGRISTLRRRWLLGVANFDSMDGSCFSQFPDKYIPWMAKTLAYHQHGMEDLLCETGI